MTAAGAPEVDVPAEAHAAIRAAAGWRTVDDLQTLVAALGARSVQRPRRRCSIRPLARKLLQSLTTVVASLAVGAHIMQLVLGASLQEHAASTPRSVPIRICACS